jgi:hypothetical protein
MVHPPLSNNAHQQATTSNNDNITTNIAAFV